MRSKVNQRLNHLMTEIESLNNEKLALQNRQNEIEIRMHQVVGAIYELQALISPESQPSEKVSSEVLPSELTQQDLRSQDPSAYVDQGTHQEQQEEIEKNNQQHS